MGINYRKKVLIKEISTPICLNCSKTFKDSDKFCSICGSKLKESKVKVFANIGKKGISSYSIKMPDGKTINSKGNITIPLGNGMSYTIT